MMVSREESTAPISFSEISRKLKLSSFSENYSRRMLKFLLTTKKYPPHYRTVIEEDARSSAEIVTEQVINSPCYHNKELASPEQTATVGLVTNSPGECHDSTKELATQDFPVCFSPLPLKPFDGSMFNNDF
ncbi:hypothetical protein Tco_0266671 [Tanacetum coccineum]